MATILSRGRSANSNTPFMYGDINLHLKCPVEDSPGVCCAKATEAAVKHMRAWSEGESARL